MAGAFVEGVPYDSVFPVQPWYQISETINYTRGYADQMRQEMSQAIQNLEGIISQYTPDWSGINRTIPDANIPNLPERPDLDLNLNENYPNENIQPPTLMDVDVDFSYDAPAAPEDVDVEFNHKPNDYSSCLWDKICDEISNRLQSGSHGLTDAVYAAIIERNREARRNAEDRARRRVMNAVGARGFDLPGGMAAAVTMEMEQDILAKDMDAVNSTTIKDFELADANSKFALELSLRAEEILRTQYANDENRLFEIAKVTKEMLVAMYEQKVKKYIAEWQGVKSRLEAARSELESIVSYNEGAVKIYEGRINAMRAQVEAVASENSARADGVRAQADIYRAESAAVSEQGRLLLEEVRVALDRYRAQVSEVVERERIAMEAAKDANTLAERISESVASLAAQAVASALGAINTSLSHGYRASESKSYNTSLSNSLSESHSYQEE